MKHARSDYARSAARFWAFVDRRGPGECWPWRGAINKRTRYGVFSNGRGKNPSAHVVAFVLQNGDLPDGKVVRHTCHNRACMNGAHLLSGTHAENEADKVAAGRQARGERNGNARLTTADVVAIKARLAAGERTRALAVEFGVCQATIAHVSRNANWRHVT